MACTVSRSEGSQEGIECHGVAQDDVQDVALDVVKDEENDEVYDVAQDVVKDEVQDSVYDVVQDVVKDEVQDEVQMQ